MFCRRSGAIVSARLKSLRRKIRMEIQAYIAALVGIAVLSGVIVFLALRLRSSRRALRIGQGRAAAILDAAVDGIITIDEDGLIESFNPPPNVCSAIVRPRSWAGMSDC